MKLRSLLDAVWNPTAASMRSVALAGVIVNTGIIVTGAAVRLTDSGLGCPTWPDCDGNSLVPTHSTQHPTVNMAIEFTNRMLTYVVLAVGIAVFVAAWRLVPRRRDVLRLAAVQPIGVIAQAVMGGVVVLVKLNPNAVSAHFLLSIVLLGFAVWLWVRTKEGDEPLRWSVRTELVWLGRALVAVVAALLWVGTMVTGSGPHAGDIHSKRYAFNIEEIAQFHTDVVWITIGLTFALVLGLRLTTATRAARRRAMELLLIELSQGVIGYTQYFLGDPSQLVIFHVLGATLVWVWTVRAFLALRERGPAAAADASKADRITEKLATR